MLRCSTHVGLHGARNTLEDLLSRKLTAVHLLQEFFKPFLPELFIVAVHGFGKAIGKEDQQIAGLKANTSLAVHAVFPHPQWKTHAAGIEPFENAVGDKQRFHLSSIGKAQRSVVQIEHRQEKRDEMAAPCVCVD